MRFFLIVAIAAGVFFRIYHADWKFYNPDEANSSLRISGHSNAQLGALIHDGARHRVVDLRLYAVPTAQTSPRDIVRSLADEDPQHPPLFFLATFAAQRLTGDSIFFRRLPAIAFGIAAIWAAWWFGRELFGDDEPALVLAALVAVSPFHVAYAQEAREYSLFLLTTCLSCALLLRSLRGGGTLAPVAYAASICAGLWGFTLFVLVALAQALYLLLPLSTAGGARRRTVFIALVAGSLTFTPWLANLFRRADVVATDTAWQTTALSAPLYAGKLIFNLGSVFLDIDYISLAWLPLALLTIAIALAASWIFLRRSTPRAWFLPVALGALTLLATVGPDLLEHETRALQSRYLTVFWLALEIATAGGLCYALAHARGVALGAWRVALATLLLCGIASCIVSSQARTWWITGSPGLRSFPAIADRLRELPAPTLVYLEDIADILLFEPYATPALAFQLHPRLDAAALRSAEHPYAILSAEGLRTVPVAPQLTRVPLETTFEMRPDPLIDVLRRRGAAARKIEGSGRLDQALYGAAAIRPSP